MPPINKILIIDDDPIGSGLLKNTLEFERYSVIVAADGVTGFQEAKNGKPDLVILDIMMPGMDGYEVCRMLQSSSETQRLPILMRTHVTGESERIKGLDLGAINFLSKDVSVKELLAHIKTILHNNKSKLEQKHKSEVSIIYDSECTLSFRVSGVTHFHSDGHSVPLSLNDLNSELVDIGERMTAFQKLKAKSTLPKLRGKYQEKRNAWERQSKRIGKDLYSKLISNLPDLLSQLDHAKSMVDSEQILVRFISPRAHLGMPWELLHDEKIPLIIEQPSCRTITEIPSRIKKENLEIFLSSQPPKRLSVLLLAGSEKLFVDEIHQVADLFREAFGDQVDIYPSPLEAVNRPQAEKLLATRAFHFIHYAGHSQFSDNHPDQSGLKLGSRVNDLITARGLFGLLKDSPTQFVFLNSCVGAQVANAETLKENDFLGLLDAIIMSGVPGALGFRWDVNQKDAMNFAVHFYGHLFETRSLEVATWRTRTEIYRSSQDSWNETWLSPILVVQNV